MSKPLAISVMFCAFATASMAVHAQTAEWFSEQDALQRRLDRTIATSPDGRIEKRLNGPASVPSPGGAAPLTLTPGDDIEFATSIGQWSTWMTKQDAKAIERGKAALPEGQTLPRPVPVTRQRFDVWTRTKTTTYKDGSGQDRANALTTSLGTDYVPMDGIVLGGVVQFDRNADKPGVAAAAVDSLGYLAGPYVGLRLVPGVTLDATVAWGQTQDQMIGLATRQFDTERRLAKARIKGDWRWHGWQFTPAASVQIAEEAASSPLEAAQLGAQLGNVNVTPRVSRRVLLGDGMSLESFMHVNTTLDFDTAATLLEGDPAKPVSTIGGGLTLAQEKDYTLSATTDLEGVGAETEPALRSRLQLTVPLP